MFAVSHVRWISTQAVIGVTAGAVLRKQNGDGDGDGDDYVYLLYALFDAVCRACRVGPYQCVFLCFEMPWRSLTRRPTLPSITHNSGALV